jgi:uncharacterized protein YciI
MRAKRTFLLISLVAMFCFTGTRAADAPAEKPGPRQFLIVLRLVPRLHDEKAWTKEDHAVVEKHFLRLKDATERGKVILAGRTEESGEKTMGLIIFEASDLEAARAFMEGDPAVAAHVMIAELHPYTVALLRKSS